MMRFEEPAGRFWKRVPPVVLQGGRVIGATDEQGTDVTERPVTIPDLFSTFYHALGISPGTEYRVDGRPVPLVTNGQPVLEIFG